MNHLKSMTHIAHTPLIGKYEAYGKMVNNQDSRLLEKANVEVRRKRREKGRLDRKKKGQRGRNEKIRKVKGNY